MNANSNNSNQPELIETPEPRAESRWFPLWLPILCGLVAYLAYTTQVSGRTGDYNARIYSPITDTNMLIVLNPKPKEDPLVAKGKATFALTCMQCHQATGLGLPNQNPPVPPLAGSEWLASGPNRVIRIVLHGFTGPVTVKGQEFNNTMVPWKDTLNDEQIAAVLTYVRQEWGNKGSAVTPAQVKAIRDKETSRSTAWTVEDLTPIPESGE